MRDKEKLLSFEEPLKFIFSHSALREGWDNPNVFQICALREIHTERERRQSIGRGLRLCVNQEGQRQRGFEVNTLTVIARESYEEFAENLQQEIESETGVRFGIVEPHQFASIQITREGGQTEYLGVEQSQLLHGYLNTQGYIDAQGKVSEPLRSALKDDALVLPDEFEPMRDAIVESLLKSVGRLEVKNADERRRMSPREAVLNSEEFKALWDRIKHKTTYRVQFDNEKLLEECAAALAVAPPIPRARLQWNRANLQIEQSGVEAELQASSEPVPLVDESIELPDVLTELQDRTQLTRKSIQRILIDSGRFDDFGVNPQKFIEVAAEAINRSKRLVLVDGIKYQRLGDDAYYAQELFAREDLTRYLKNMLAAKKSVYDYVAYDSDNEAKFAEQLEKNTAVKVYAKLPGWFQIPTPLGSYNPDWAVLAETGSGERLYFVVETKGTSFLDDLRNTERAKVECGKAHFGALKGSGTLTDYQAIGEAEAASRKTEVTPAGYQTTKARPAEYRIVRTLDELMASK